MEVYIEIMYRMYFFLFTSCFINCLGFSQDAQEQWETYFTDFYGEVGAVTVDLSYQNETQVQSHPVSIKMVVQLLETRENGMPTEKELDLIYDIEDEVLLFSKQALLEVGTIVTAGNHETYFYGSSALGLDSVIGVIRSRHPDRRIELLEAEDPEWNTYWFVLFPPDLELLKMNNAKQLAYLLEREEYSGELMFKFILRFKSLKMRKKFYNAIKDEEFELIEERIDNEALPYVLVLGRKEALILESINETTTYLFLSALNFKGAFDSWKP